MTQPNTAKKIDSNGMNTSDLSAETITEKDATSQAVLSLVTADKYQINSSIIQENIKFDFYTNGKSIKIEIGLQKDSIQSTSIEIPLGKINSKDEKISKHFEIEYGINGVIVIGKEKYGPYYYFQKNKDNSISQIQIPLSLQNVKNTDIFDENPKAEFNGNLYFYNREKSCVEFLEEKVKKVIQYSDFYIVIKENKSIIIFYEGKIYHLKFLYFCKFDNEKFTVNRIFGKPEIIDGFENLKQYLKQ